MEEENKVPVPEEVVTKTRSVGRIVLIILGLVVIFAAGLAIGWYFQSQAIDTSQPVVLDQVNEQDRVLEQMTDEQKETLQEKLEDSTPRLIENPNTVQIDWLPVDEQYPTDSDYRLVDIFFADVMPQELSGNGAGAKTYVLGTVEGGQYDGYELHHFMAGLTGMGTYINGMYLLVNEDGFPNDVVVLENYLTQVSLVFSHPSEYREPDELFYGGEWEEIEEQFTVESEITITELEISETVTDEDGVELYSTGVWVRSDYPYNFPVEDFTVITTTKDGTNLRLYKDDEHSYIGKENAFFYVREDGRIEFIAMEIPFYEAGDTFDEIIPNITWNDGTENMIGYVSHEISGCGFPDQYKVVDDESITGNLIAAGTYSGGVVYEPVDLDTDYYREFFETWSNLSPEEKTWEEFTAAHPFFYWQDPYGRWLEFMSVDVMPAVECGKPVIYLYPEETMEIGVEIELEKMSYSEPEYKDGWNVIANPDGTLVELETGEEYPYLFWEGLGDSYVSPVNYWVVAQAEVEPFLIETLTKLGLNTQEIADFNEFWVPRMEEAPYYQIGFHGTEVMNQIAPLALTEKPDSVLRVLMDYQELDTPIPNNPPTFLPSFTRNGFTLVEWGGVLR